MKFGVADYGLNVWHGGLYDLESRLQNLRELGFEGIKRLEANGSGDALGKAALCRRCGMDFATCRGARSCGWRDSQRECLRPLGAGVSSGDEFPHDVRLEAAPLRIGKQLVLLNLADGKVGGFGIRQNKCAYGCLRNHHE